MGDVLDALHTEAFLHEGLALSIINNPRVIRKIDCRDGTLGIYQVDCLVTEYNFTETMYSMIIKEKENPKLRKTQAQTLNLFTKVVETIADIYKTYKILHCDLKTENILVNQDGDDIKIIDFGCAKIRNTDSPYVEQHFLKPAHYRAPELLPKIIGHDEKSEVFALGCILFALLFYSNPFSNARSDDPLYKFIYDGEYEKYWSIVEKYKGHVNEEIKKLLNSLFALKPNNRPNFENLLANLFSIKL